MPTYEYGCSTCHHLWEEVKSITEPTTKKCPKCSTETAERIISSGGGFILKGEGYYKPGGVI